MDKESTPLLSSAKGGGNLHPKPVQVLSTEGSGLGVGAGPTRRRNGQQEKNDRNIEEHFANQFQMLDEPLPPPRQRKQNSPSKGKVFIDSGDINGNGNDNDNGNDDDDDDDDDNDKESKKQYNRSLFQDLSASVSILKEVLPIKRRNRTKNRSTKSTLTLNSNDSKSKIISAFSVDSGCDNDSALYYEDNYNDLPWKCSFGTAETDGIWMNNTDVSGIIMSSMVWIMILYSGFTVTILAQNNKLHSTVAIIYCTLCALALSAHAKTTFTDPGAIPQTAVPTEEDGINRAFFPMCSVCETYKPKHTHHCRICNRCVSGMDHHCPWMNNCIGRGNMKHFILFLVYVWLASAYALCLFAINYFLCNSDECAFPQVLVQLVRIMTFLCIGAFVFTSNMIMTVLWGMVTGLGTIDRMKREEQVNSNNDTTISNEPPIPWEDIFGTQHYYSWFLPIDPMFDDYDRIMGYSTLPRLRREKKLNGNGNGNGNGQSNNFSSF